MHWSLNPWCKASKNGPSAWQPPHWDAILEYTNLYWKTCHLKILLQTYLHTHMAQTSCTTSIASCSLRCNALTSSNNGAQCGICTWRKSQAIFKLTSSTWFTCLKLIITFDLNGTHPRGSWHGQNTIIDFKTIKEVDAQDVVPSI